MNPSILSRFLYFASSLLVVLTACDAAPGDQLDAGLLEADARVPPDAGDGALAPRDAADGVDTGDADQGDAAGDGDVGDGSAGDGGAGDGGVGDGGLMSPVAPTTGPVMVTGSFAPPDPVPMVDGFAYYDPTDEIGAAAPELRIVMTSWPVNTCDPLSVSQDEAAKSGRWWARFSIARTRNPPFFYDIFESKYFFQDFFWEQKPTSGFFVDLSSGDDDGGEQVVGTIRLTGGAFSESLTGETFTFRVNHCGILDTPNW